jgi:hypothetical protein
MNPMIFQSIRVKFVIRERVFSEHSSVPNRRIVFSEHSSVRTVFRTVVSSFVNNNFMMIILIGMHAQLCDRLTVSTKLL